MDERSDIEFVAKRTVTRRGGSLYVILPREVSRILHVSNGDIIAFLLDRKRSDLLLARQIESKFKGVNEKTITIRYSLHYKEESEVFKILEKSGAYLPERHYKLASGKHSNRYIQVRIALTFDKYAKRLGQMIAEKFQDDNIRVVSAFTVGGFRLAEVIAKSLHAKLVLGRRKPRQRKIDFVNASIIETGDGVLVVDDVLTTGGTLRDAIRSLASSSNGVLKGVAVVVDRSKGKVEFDVKTIKLIRLDLEQYEPESCPWCKRGEPIFDLSLADLDLSVVLDTMSEQYQPAIRRIFERYLRRLEEAEMTAKRLQKQRE